MSAIEARMCSSDSGPADLGSPLMWWRRHEPRVIKKRRDDLLSEISVATRGLAEDAFINAALGGRCSAALVIADHLASPTSEDLSASWVCWAASCGDALAIAGIADLLAHRHYYGGDEEELALLAAWHVESSCRGRLWDPPGIRKSLEEVETFMLARAAARETGAEVDVPEVAKTLRPRNRLQPTLRVVSSIGDADAGEGRRLAVSYKALTKPLPLCGGNTSLDVLRVVLLREFPWMWEPIESLFDELALRRAAGIPWLHFSPILMTGPSGIGKTRFARRLAQLSGTGYREINAAGSSDNRLLMGTARGWESSQPALPLLTMRTNACANPIIVVDEIDKTRSDGRNGDIRDTLLSLLEPETASAWFDECLMAKCDLSQISWVLTANEATHLPGPLLSRVHVMSVERPMPAHFDALLKAILADFARELGLAADALPELAPEAKDLLRARFARYASVRDLKATIRRAISKSSMLLNPVIH